MSGTMQAQQVRSRRWVRAAWFAVALVPIGWGAAFFVGEGLLAAQGYDSGDPVIPAGAVLLAGVPAMVVMLAPCAAAFACGWRAGRDDPRGRAPAIVGALLGLIFLVSNLVGLIGRAVG